MYHDTVNMYHGSVKCTTALVYIYVSRCYIHLNQATYSVLSYILTVRCYIVTAPYT